MIPKKLSLLLVLALFTISCEVFMISEEEELKLGRQFVPVVEQEFNGVLEDEDLNRYVAFVGRRLARVCERPHLNYTFKVLNTPTINAFAVPGGFIYITRGLLYKLENEAQLAGILGHEIGHIAYRHSAKQMSKATWAQLLLVIGAVIAAEKMDAEDAARLIEICQIAAILTLLRFSREDELQADRAGIRYSYSRGYNPQAMVEVFRMFHKLSKKYPRLPEFLSSHPKPKRRIKEAKKYVAKLPEAQKRKLHRLSFKTGTKYFFKRYDAYKKYDKAMQKFVNKKYNEAIKFINEAIKIHKDDSSFYTLKGQIYFATQKYKLAGKSLRKALKINRKNIFANLTYGHLLFHKRRFNLSEKYFGTALNINPSNIEARFYLAESLFLQDKKTDAKPHYQTIVIFAERHGYKKGSDLEYYYIKSRKRLRQIG